MADIKGITIRFRADTVTFARDMKNLNFAMSALKREAKEINSKLKFDGLSKSGIADQMRNLKSQLKVANEQARQYKQTMESVSSQYKKGDIWGDEQAREWASAKRGYEETIRAQRELKKKIAETKELLTDFAGTNRDTLDVIAEKAENAAEKFDTLAEKTSEASRIAQGLFKTMVTSATDYEKAFAGVKKTVEGTEEDFENISNAIIEASKELPITAVELSGIAEAAGQLGVGAEDIAAFTKVMAELGIATNLNGEEAATEIARIYNIMGDGLSTVDEFGAALTYLGNNTAASEKEILALATRLASAANQVGFTESELLGLASAMADVGMEAASGGSSISKTLVAIDKAVARNDESLKSWAAFAGTSVEEFKELWNTDAVEAFARVIDGLASSEENLNLNLDELGITELRQSDAMRRLAGNAGALMESVAAANREWNENAALEEEVAKRNETLDAKYSELKNTLTALAIEFADSVLPLLKTFVEFCQQVVDWVSKMPEPLQNLLISLLAITAALSPMFKTASNISIVTKNATALLKKSLPVISTLFSSKILPVLKTIMGLFSGWQGVAIAIIGVGVALAALYRNCEPFKKFVDNMIQGFISGIKSILGFFEKIWDWLKKITNISDNKTIGDVQNTPIINNKHLPSMIIDSGGFGTLNLTTQIHVNNNGQPINESEIRRWGDTITDIVSVNLGKRLA